MLVKETEEDRFVTLLLACLDPGTSGQGIDEPNSRKVGAEENVPQAREGRANDWVPCDLRQGLPTTPTHVWSHYLSQKGRNQMLVLDRKPNQRIRINGGIDLVILAVRNGEVEVGIEYPSELPTDGEGVSI
ncbi:MAG: carbon storage regulator [Pirellulaceae bacterium]